MSVLCSVELHDIIVNHFIVVTPYIYIYIYIFAKNAFIKHVYLTLGCFLAMTMKFLLQLLGLRDSLGLELLIIIKKVVVFMS